MVNENIRILYVHYKLSPIGLNSIKTSDKPYPQIFDNDFLNNNQIQLYQLWLLFNNTSFQCLFHLLPNLKIIKPYILSDALLDDSVKNKLNSLKIEPVNMLHGFYTLTELFYYLCECYHLDWVSIPI